MLTNTTIVMFTITPVDNPLLSSGCTFEGITTPTALGVGFKLTCATLADAFTMNIGPNAKYNVNYALIETAR